MPTVFALLNMPSEGKVQVDTPEELQHVAAFCDEHPGLSDVLHEGIQHLLQTAFPESPGVTITLEADPDMAGWEWLVVSVKTPRSAADAQAHLHALRRHGGSSISPSLGTFCSSMWSRCAEALWQQRGTFASEEACCRASISRAYYAIFGAARQYAVTIEGLESGRTGEVHRQVQRHFQHGLRPQQRLLGALLARLRRTRNRADYAEIMTDAVWQAEIAIADDHKAFAVLHALQS